jgi:hypothetical protein
MDLAERVSAAVPTAADSWSDTGTFTVPAGMTRIKKVRIGLAPDWGVTAISVRHALVIRLLGSALQEQSPHEFLAMFGGVSVVTTGGLQQNELVVEYETDIPVQAGTTFVAQQNSLDEVITAGTVFVNIEYDDKPISAKNSMSQYVDAAGTTTADAFATVGTITIPKTESGKDPTKIIGIAIGVAIDQGTSAIALRTSPTVRLSGAGVKGSGTREYIGPCQSTAHNGTTPSQGIASDHGTVMREVDIDINAGGQILIEHQYITETPTASTIAVGLLYR